MIIIDDAPSMPYPLSTDIIFANVSLILLTNPLESGILHRIIDFIAMPSRHHLSRKGQNALFQAKREAGFGKRRKAKAIRMRKLEAKAK
ncbi:MAG: hypothetical protein AAB839_00175 [Patescibacteria group bacterium]